MTVVEYHGNTRVQIPRLGLTSYSPLAQKVMQMFIDRKIRQGCNAVTIIRVTNQHDPRNICIYFHSTNPGCPEERIEGTYGGPER